MCVSACTRKIVEDVSRRNFLRGAAGLAAAATVAGCVPVTKAPGAVALPGGFRFSQIVDLTHTLTPDFPTYSGMQQLEIETVVTLAANGYNVYRWILEEHTGTHMDAPFHFSDGPTEDQLPAESLFGPLAVIDIRAKAAESADAQLTPDDLQAWKATHGDLPPGCCVAMLSGWGAHVNDPMFRNADAAGAMHFPGFHAEAAQMLMEEGDVAGIAVDTLSLDYGMSPDFAVHYAWLPSGRWGVECIANLDAVPATGATLIVGAPKHRRGTGGPARVFTLF